MATRKPKAAAKPASKAAKAALAAKATHAAKAGERVKAARSASAKETLRPAMKTAGTATNGKSGKAPAARVNAAARTARAAGESPLRAAAAHAAGAASPKAAPAVGKAASTLTATVQAPVRPKERFLVFGQPLIEAPEKDEIRAVLDSAWLGTGPRVARFEKEFKEYVGAEHGTALYSCTAALHLSMLAAGIKPGDEVITTPLTFCATANAILHAGGRPVLADVDPDTQNISVESINEKVTTKTKAILPVHFAGRACDMDGIMEIAEDHRLTVVEDCAHAIETEYHGRKAGTFGDYGCFSFYATKNVAAGEGGMVITKTEEQAARIKVLGLHGMSRDAWKRFGSEGYKHYAVTEVGFKYNMMDLQAAIAIHQLARVEKNWQRRQELWRRYDKAFSGLPVGTPAPAESNTRHALHLYTLMVDEAECGIPRDAFLARMTGNGIGVGVHYLALPEHPVYQNMLSWKPEDVPNATRIGRETVSIPLSPKVTDADAADVVAAVRASLEG